MKSILIFYMYCLIRNSWNLLLAHPTEKYGWNELKSSFLEYDCFKFGSELNNPSLLNRHSPGVGSTKFKNLFNVYKLKHFLILN